MYIDFSPEEAALRSQLREYFAELMTPELEEEAVDSEGGDAEWRKAVGRMASDGWLGVGWPTEYGGQARPPMDQFIFSDEAFRSGFPFPLLTIGTVGPTLAEFGSEEQKTFFLPKILAGEVNFAIGYSESDAGTDLASLSTRAERDGDEWVINGQKMWTSLANFADYVWLAARTDPDAEKHAGLTIFIVDTKLEGFRHTPVHTVGGVQTNATYYDNVRVPHSAVVGGEGMGWGLIVNQLKYERTALVTPGLVERLYEQTLEWARAKRPADGRRAIDRSWVRDNLARVRAKLDVLKLLNWRQVSTMSADAMDFAQSSTCKVYGTEFYIEAYGLLLEVLGEEAALKRGSPEARLKGKLEKMYRAMLILTFGGGTNEIQRELIAMAGLAMPRAKR